ncbi:MAG: pyridoxamine 5'-phosphate oxidase, partial [Thauera sp.]|nr:pyridoxamine 5'-phosphate oxidase [Thauera sp.]
MSKHTPLSDLRKSYEQGTLEEHDSASEPSRQFEAWL